MLQGRGVVLPTGAPSGLVAHHRRLPPGHMVVRAALLTSTSGLSGMQGTHPRGDQFLQEVGIRRMHELAAVVTTRLSKGGSHACFTSAAAIPVGCLQACRSLGPCYSVGNRWLITTLRPSCALPRLPAVKTLLPGHYSGMLVARLAQEQRHVQERVRQQEQQLQRVEGAQREKQQDEMKRRIALVQQMQEGVRQRLSQAGVVSEQEQQQLVLEIGRAGVKTARVRAARWLGLPGCPRIEPGFTCCPCSGCCRF